MPTGCGECRGAEVDSCHGRLCSALAVSSVNPWVVDANDAHRGPSLLLNRSKGEQVAKKEEQVKAFVHVRQSWIETTGLSTLFKTANFPLSRDGILIIPVTRFDISDNYFVDMTFYPRELEKQPVKSVKTLIPKQEIVLIVELKSPDGFSTLGYKRDVGN